jgi:hypothetical protein
MIGHHPNFYILSAMCTCHSSNCSIGIVYHPTNRATECLPSCEETDYFISELLVPRLLERSSTQIEVYMKSETIVKYQRSEVYTIYNILGKQD